MQLINNTIHNQNQTIYMRAHPKIYKIEKDIPLTPQIREGGALSQLTPMQIGDSFFVPIEDLSVSPKSTPTNKVSSRFYYAAERLKIKIGTRVIKDESRKVLGIRVWRIE